ncbi:unnamed protein product [Mytilus edulis]|uniref:B box-type domain-containing protein n=1 Tax=Mytilus edulis TaxID=6550 RepID=A0A8S3RCW2_MYTED|nr:unnamed protein product [Mytilus edulis]
MASSVKDCCTLCKDDGTSTEVIRWCIECEGVFLCTDCEKHHKKLRMSKAHNTMSTKDYHNLPKFMQEISSQCRDHKKNPFTLQLKAGRKDQAQYLVPTIPTIEQIKPSFLRHLKIQQDMQNIDIQACRILPDGRYLLLLYNIFGVSNMLMFSNEGILIGEVVKFEGPFDICFVRNNTVAVTLEAYFNRNQIVLVDVDKNEILKELTFLTHINQ